MIPFLLAICRVGSNRRRFGRMAGGELIQTWKKKGPHRAAQDPDTAAGVNYPYRCGPAG